MTADETIHESKMVCAFCNAEWTPEMEMELGASSSGCATCGYGGYQEYVVTIRCPHCGRVVYRKEGRESR